MKITRRQLKKIILQEMLGDDPIHHDHRGASSSSSKKIKTLDTPSIIRKDQIDPFTGFYQDEDIEDISWEEHIERIMNYPDLTGEAPEGFYDNPEFDTYEWDRINRDNRHKP
jgi:hypothetical protein